MNLELLAFLEKMTLGELKVLSVLLESLNARINTANLTADNALSQINIAISKDASLWDINKRFQLMTAPTQFGTINANNAGVRGTHFIFGQYGFLGYENNADETDSVVLDNDYAQITGQDLRDLEVVNRRTLTARLAETTQNIQGAFISKDGDTGNSGASFTFPILIASVTAEYASDQIYTHWNSKSFVNFGYITDVLNLKFNDYLLLSGGIVTDLHISNVSIDPTSVVTHEQIANLFTNPPTLPALQVADAPINPTDVVRLEDISNGAVIAPSTRYPVWVSGKIALSDVLEETKAGSYLTSKITFGSTDTYVAKILKYSGNAAFDNSDLDFNGYFTASEKHEIYGHVAQTFIPFPVDYTLYVEYDANMSTFGNPRRCSVPVSTSQLPYSAFIDVSGDLSLAIQAKSGGAVNVPWLESALSVVGNDDRNILFYLVINKWSYISLNHEYFRSVSVHPAIFLPSSVTYPGMTGPVDRDLLIITHDIDWTQTVTWTAVRDSANSDTGTLVTAVTDSRHLTLHFPNNISTESITFTLSGSAKDVNGNVVALGPLTVVAHSTA